MARKPEYGRGPEIFLEYEHFIVDHPKYAGMPDVYNDDGEIQWEAPSNRKSGKHKDTHRKRRDWWIAKANSVGFDPNAPHWISKTAKSIHPTKKKPCKNCGRVMDLRYSYPSSRLIRRIKRLDFIDESFPIDILEHITGLVTRLVEQFGDKALTSLPVLLSTPAIQIPEIAPKLENWLDWIEGHYIPAEPPTLSPGAMSNAPDRLDGFHSFNLCCRSKTDTGRSKANLQSYTTDRRVFEYWVEGDWVAADRLMGLIRSDKLLRNEICVNGHPGPCSADHIGPISLGFVHRPEFQLLCKKCNSAKNNRMSLRDVRHLRRAEKRGEQVVSWYCKALWERRRGSVVDEETALRISKLLRDNRHTLMRILERIAVAGHFTFLATLLELDCAMSAIKFINLRVNNHVTKFDKLIHTARTTKYSVQQQARRLRVAFDVLRDYFGKLNRSAFVISTDTIEKAISEALWNLNKSPSRIKRLDARLKLLLSAKVPSEEKLRRVVLEIPSRKKLPIRFIKARKSLRQAMNYVSKELANQWGNDRYVRAPLDDDMGTN